jgi:copper resistance protein B
MKRAISSGVLGLGLLASLSVLAAEDHANHQQAEPTSPGEAQHGGHQPAQAAQPAPQGAHAAHADPDKAESSNAQQSQQPDHADHGAHQAHSANDLQTPTESERAHIPPDPPQNPLHDMSEERMIELMQMEDNAPYSMILADQLEWRDTNDADTQAWELQAWYGTDYNKLWIETEGDRTDEETGGRAEVMWDRIISRWWSIQSGVRHDFGEGPSRTWADIGIQGLAPYFFEIDAAMYVGEEGRTAARFSAEYDMLITQRLILQPELEFELYGKDDPENGIGSGLSDVEFGVRLRYEIRREFAPYVGVHWERKFGGTADLARAESEDVSDVVFVAGLRAWF